MFVRIVFTSISALVTGVLSDFKVVFNPTFLNSIAFWPALKNVSKEDINLSKIMIKIMKEKPGIGLAANQIGILKQIVTVHVNDKEKNLDKIYALFNPKIINKPVLSWIYKLCAEWVDHSGVKYSDTRLILL